VCVCVWFPLHLQTNVKITFENFDLNKLFQKKSLEESQFD
jgi:hypothetical protein